MTDETLECFVTAQGIRIRRTRRPLPPGSALEAPLSRIDAHRGAIFSSGYEYPGRYARWDLGFVDPPLEFVAQGRRFRLSALNERGSRLIGMLDPVLLGCPGLAGIARTATGFGAEVPPDAGPCDEENRSQRPTVFTPLRRLLAALRHPDECHLGFYGAAGHDLAFQFEPIRLRHPRSAHQVDLHLFLPDALVVVDHRKDSACLFEYDFEDAHRSTRGLPRITGPIALPGSTPPRPGSADLRSDHAPAEYARKVEAVRQGCFRGDYFEVTLSQTFERPFGGSPSGLFRRLRGSNPSPYEFLINLGGEQLIGASPEMFVRVEGGRVETCPIAGTARRPDSLMEEPEVIRNLLLSHKDEAELTMCSDVDRNDKARVCKPGSVRVLGRRQIETYSRLFHTVDHIEGELRDDCDGFDALLSHMWACTLTGAPKPAALQAIEDLESSPRGWYGGCIGFFLANGDINTGITIRTVRLADGVARVRVGATLLADSDPDAEEIETRVKASAFLDALVEDLPHASAASAAPPPPILTGRGKRVLFVDHRDSFVHTLADYVRQTGASVRTLRAGFPHSELDAQRPDLVFLSPGPGRPSDFDVAGLVLACADRGIPVFGVCLGLQGMVEAFGGSLGQLDFPMHGKCSTVSRLGGVLLDGLPHEFEVGRYHSLYALEERLPPCLEVTARSRDGVVMAVEHRTLPLAAVQFHPESILSLKGGLGLRLIANVLDRLALNPASGSPSLVEPVGVGDVIATDA